MKTSKFWKFFHQFKRTAERIFILLLLLNSKVFQSTDRRLLLQSRPLSKKQTVPKIRVYSTAPSRHLNVLKTRAKSNLCTDVHPVRYSKNLPRANSLNSRSRVPNRQRILKSKQTYKNSKSYQRKLSLKYHPNISTQRKHKLPIFSDLIHSLYSYELQVEFNQ